MPTLANTLHNTKYSPQEPHHTNKITNLVISSKLTIFATESLSELHDFQPLTLFNSMEVSKKVAQLMKLYNLKPKDVYFAFLVSAGASRAEAFAAIFRPASTTTAALSSKASQYIGQTPSLPVLLDELCRNPDTDEPTPRRGRPRKKEAPEVEDVPTINYTDKDALLKELAGIAGRAEKDSDRLAALREIGSLQRMKQEAAVEDEKRVTFYVPLSFDRCAELLAYLQRYYAEKEQ